MATAVFVVTLLVMGVSAMYCSYNEPFKAAVYRLLDGQAPLRRREASDEPAYTALPYARLRTRPIPIPWRRLR